ncbi:MAG: TIR domain-containing protein [Bacteroidaceae bacterium]|nr:TIR domain-containing protein [Bacteroidaceae bacterium]
MKYDVFISYSSKDQKVAEGVCAYLEQYGIRCFVAYRDIPRAVVWATAIVEALEHSRMMLVLFSENFNHSSQVEREIELASEEKMPILTFRLSDDAFRGAKKYYLQNLNWIDAFPHPERYFESLRVNIFSLLEKNVEPLHPLPPFSSSLSSRMSTLKKWFLPFIVSCLLLIIFILWPNSSSEPAPVPTPEPVPVEYSDSTPVQTQVDNEPEKVQAHVKEEAPAPAQLYVTTSPTGATVYVDGKEAGTSPIEGKEYAQGDHTIKITLDGYKVINAKVQFGEKPVILNEALVKVEEKHAPVKEEVPAPVQKQTEQQVFDSQVATAAATSGTINGHEWVDLGLSVKWATCNIGATAPEEYGDYFAWGETTTKSEYTKENSKTYRKVFSDIAGNPEYDAARANWGSSWRLPTPGECLELEYNCTWLWTIKGGNKGYKVTSKKNGNSIFLPAAGMYEDFSCKGAGEYGCYRNSCRYSCIGFSRTRKSDFLSFSADVGCTLRPVSE